MSPKTRQANVPVTPRTHGVEPRCIQTSGIFRLPAELIVETLSYFGDPHRNILSDWAQGIIFVLERVERLTVIRKLTMTCWHLRNVLFPLLWNYVEGCRILPNHPAEDNRPFVSLESGLYPQCTYVILNPTIGVYVRALSVDLHFMDAPKDLMTKLVDCLILLPNLRTLEIFNTNEFDHITRGRLERKRARFPSVRELLVDKSLTLFIEKCPNVESITVTRSRLTGVESLISYGMGLKRLKRVAGVYKTDIYRVAQGYPHLQEIGIVDTMEGFSGKLNDTRAFEHLRSLKRLTIVDLEVITPWSSPDERLGTAAEYHRAQTEKNLELWKNRLIGILRDSPSTERKFLGWKVHTYQRRVSPGRSYIARALVQEGKLEVLPETPL